MPRRKRAFRNPVARSPLLHKGGVHVQSKTGQRARQRMNISSAIDEWQDEISDDSTPQNDEKGSEGSPFLFLLQQIPRKCGRLRTVPKSNPDTMIKTNI